MKQLFYVDHFIHDFGLAKVSRNPVEHERVNVRLELVRFHGCIDCLSPQLHCDVVWNELPFACVFKKGLSDLRARVNGTEYVAAGAMIKPWDRAERFALCAFATARRG